MPATETRYTNPPASLQASSMRSSVLVGASNGTMSSPFRRQASSRSPASSCGTSGTIMPSAPDAARSVQNRSSPYAITGPA